jgi:hypothetical protein
MQTRSFDEAEKMIEDELDEDFQSSSPVVERDVTVSCLFFFHLNVRQDILTESRDFKMISSSFWISVRISKKIST